MSQAKRTAALFVRSDSIYKTIPGVDCYDIDRDALTFPGGMPVVAHPPCRAWGVYRWKANPRPGEKGLARWAVKIVRINGGVLEHPLGSALWREMHLPEQDEFPDAWGGYTLVVDQCDWGHLARKRSKLYICGAPVPRIPDKRGRPTHCMDTKREYRTLPILPKSKRELTPPDFAKWLVAVARSSRQ